MIDEKWVLITGASGGIGEELAYKYDREGYCCLLVARSEGELKRVAMGLKNSSLVFPLDLSVVDNFKKLENFVAEKKLNLHVLINNAGFGYAGDFTKESEENIISMVNLNVLSLTILTKTMIPHLMGKPDATIINIASVGGLFPVKYMSVYGATKAYVVSFSKALAMELKNSNINVLVVCPAGVNTGFAKVSSGKEAPQQMQKSSASADSIAHGIYNSMLSKKQFVILPKSIGLMLTILPTKIITKMFATLMERMLKL